LTRAYNDRRPQGKLPFDDENIRKLLHKVKSGVFTMPQFLNRDLQDLISKMLTVDPEQRISIHDVRTHPWYLRRTPRPSTIPKLSCSVRSFARSLVRSFVRLRQSASLIDDISIDGWMADGGSMFRYPPSSLWMRSIVKY